MNWKRIIVATIVFLSIASIAVGTAEAYTYNRNAAAQYAIDNWNKNVLGSWRFGSNDCTNFVSWSVYNGGWPMIRSGSHYQMWYYEDIWRHSYSWTVADYFGKFITNSGRGQGFTLTRNPPWNFRVGDIIQIDYGKNFVMDHTMIVTKVTSNDVYVTYHWADGPYVSLTSLMNKYPNDRFVGYQLYDSFSK